MWRLNDQPDFIDGILGICVASISRSLFAKGVDRLMMQELLLRWCCSFFLGVVVLDKLGYHLFAGFIQKDDHVFDMAYVRFGS